MALMQVENLEKLIEGNRWQDHMRHHVISLKGELMRQYSGGQ